VKNKTGPFQNENRNLEHCTEEIDHDFEEITKTKSLPEGAVAFNEEIAMEAYQFYSVQHSKHSYGGSEDEDDDKSNEEEIWNTDEAKFPDCVYAEGKRFNPFNRFGK
jgi:hypothetical protein